MSTTDITRAPPATADPAQPAPIGVWPVLALGLTVEAALLVGLVWPLRIWRPPDAITASEPLSAMLGQSPSGLVRFVLTLVIWCSFYLLAAGISHRTLSTGAQRLLFIFPVLFALTLAVTWPAASKDLYHYVLEGRTLAVHGENPLTTPPAALPTDPLLWIVSSWEWEPSRYGPLWALIAAIPAALAGDDLRAAVLGFKAIGLASFLATAALVYATARRVRPDAALPAFVFLAWNPLLLFESTANAHNDIPMLAFTALALFLAARRNWMLAFPALAAAVLIKYTTGLLGPFLLLWAWQGAQHYPSERRRITAGLALAAGLVIACYAPFWTGPNTLSALTGAAGDALNSPGWLFRETLERLGASETVARLVVSIPLTALFIAAYALLLRRIWTADRTFATFAFSGFAAITLYLWTLSWWFWPWYVTWVLPLAAILVGHRAARFTLVWSLAALVAYIPINFRPLFWGEPPDDRMPLAVALTIFGSTAVAAITLFIRRKRPSPVGAGNPGPTGLPLP